MKAISIRQPWAWLVVHGYKDVDNRTWATKHRGPILIHAGKALDPCECLGNCSDDAPSWAGRATLAVTDPIHDVGFSHTAQVSLPVGPIAPLYLTVGVNVVWDPRNPDNNGWYWMSGTMSGFSAVPSGGSVS